MADIFADPDLFAKVLYNYVKPAVIAEAVDHTLPPTVTGDARKNYIARLAPDALNDALRQMQAVAADIFKRDVVRAFCKELGISDPNNTALQGILSRELSVDATGKVNKDALQSLKNRRQPFMTTKLYDLLAVLRKRVCAICVDKDIKGTGFLVARDLVLTARHVLDTAELIRREPGKDPSDDDVETSDAGPMRDTAAPGSRERLKCVFDYETLANPFDPLNPPGDVTVVPVAANWLVWSSLRHPQDGRQHDFPPPPAVLKRMDCAVIRLERPVGALALDANQSILRGWMELSNNAPLLKQNDFIAIWQHAEGGPVVFDKGAFFTADSSMTRVFYQTETAGGSSGSPCFDFDGEVVAFHNAGVIAGFTGPTKDCNQGIRIDHVIQRMTQDLQQELKGISPKNALWFVSGDGEPPRAVLNRDIFKKAVDRLFDPLSARRLIAVDEEEDIADIGKSGKSFSVRMLQALARDRPGLVIALRAEELKSLEPENFLREMGRRIGAAQADLDGIPPKPTDERQVTSWWASDLPQWFGQTVENWAIAAGNAPSNKVVDAATGAAIGRELVIKELIWIAIDDFHKHPPEGGMKELLAGLTAITDTQPVLRPGLKALRWLFVGHVPDFVRERSIEYEHERISQKKIGEDDWVECIRSAFISKGIAEKFDLKTAKAFYTVVTMVQQAAALADPTKILETLSEAVLATISDMEKKARQ